MTVRATRSLGSRAPEKLQHLTTVSSELRRAQHVCEPCPGILAPLCTSISSIVSTRAVGCNGANAAVFAQFVSSVQLRLPFPPPPAADQCSSPPLPDPLVLAGHALKHTLLRSARPSLVPYTLRFTS